MTKLSPYSLSVWLDPLDLVTWNWSVHKDAKSYSNGKAKTPAEAHFKAQKSLHKLLQTSTEAASAAPTENVLCE